MALSVKEGRVWIRLKVVPGAARTALAGRLGDRLKVRVAAPPEAGAANRALLEFLAERLALSPRDLTLVAGSSSPLKTVAVQGRALEDVAQALGLG
jgi:hypothetical protein